MLAGQPWNCGLIPAGTGDLFLLQNFLPSCGSHPVSYSVGASGRTVVELKLIAHLHAVAAVLIRHISAVTFPYAFKSCIKTTLPSCNGIYVTAKIQKQKKETRICFVN